jgi:hypothetical protein
MAPIEVILDAEEDLLLPGIDLARVSGIIYSD